MAFGQHRDIVEHGVVQLAPVKIDHDLVAVLDKGDRAADGGLRADMADDQTEATQMVLV